MLSDRRISITGRRRLALAGPALALLFLVPAVVSAHPLGNFTVNHYAGVRVEPDRILLDVVIDQAEIPTFQARLGFDLDGDGEVSDAETDAGRLTACAALAPDLRLEIDGVRQSLDLAAAGLSFPPGVGGLSTMRMVCEFEVHPVGGFDPGARLTFTDAFASDRLGWREIVVGASGVTVAGVAGPLRSTSPSDRLTHYPTNLLASALHDTDVALTVTPGGPFAPVPAVPDARPVIPEPTAAPQGHTAETPRPSASAAAAVIGATGAVPGGVSIDDLPTIFRSADLSPFVLLASILTAAVLGAGHALTPGHGKTLMAAYLVGSSGRPIHAAGLGLSVTFAHTLGILILAALVVGAQGVLPADIVATAAPRVAAISIILIGGWMLLAEGRRRWSSRRARADASAAGHPHAGGGHTHPIPGAPTISWRGLFALGLAGGIVPSTSALLILLGSIAAGRPAFGFALVVAFGLGMAVVLAGIGSGIVMARGRLARLPVGPGLGRASEFVPLAAAVLVLGFGCYLMAQAVTGTTL